jgi:hypothetical protein
MKKKKNRKKIERCRGSDIYLIRLLEQIIEREVKFKGIIVEDFVIWVKI